MASHQYKAGEVIGIQPQWLGASLFKQTLSCLNVRLPSYSTRISMRVRPRAAVPFHAQLRSIGCGPGGVAPEVGSVVFRYVLQLHLHLGHVARVFSSLVLLAHEVWGEQGSGQAPASSKRVHKVGVVDPHGLLIRVIDAQAQRSPLLIRVVPVVQFDFNQGLTFGCWWLLGAGTTRRHSAQLVAV